MNTFFDGTFWNRHFQDAYIPHVNLFCDILVERVLPLFDKIDEEAEEAASARFDKLEHDFPPDADIGAYAEAAIEFMSDYGIALYSVYQTLLNASLTVLYHIFEQQLLAYHRRQLLPLKEEDNSKKLKFRIVQQLLKDGGVDITSFKSWKQIEELNLIANATKHAEGPSAEKLRKVRPELFTPNYIYNNPDLQWLASSSPSLYMPLAGDDLYVTVEDIRMYQQALVDFWAELGEAIMTADKSHRRRAD